NRRTKKDTPDFGVRKWPEEQYGEFFEGDSYIVLNTYKLGGKNEKKAKLAWDLHFWLGSKSTQDEIGVAAYKTVELDTLLDDGPVQHRETQGNESELFLSYFKQGVRYLKGGIESGFRHVKADEYEPRLFHLKKNCKIVQAKQVKCSYKK